MNLILIFILVDYSICSYIASSSTSQCISVESSSSNKWCRYLTDYASGYNCTYSDSSSVCGGDSNYRCSCDTSNLPQNSKNLLCPTNTVDCNTQTLSLSTSTSIATASTNNFSTGTVCWYKFTPGDSSIKSIRIYMTSLSNANAEVYEETSTNTYNYKGSVSTGDSLNITIGTYDAIWVLISPTSNNANANMAAYASSYSNSYSSYLSTGVIVAIVVGSVCCCCCFVLTLGMVIGCFFSKKKKSKQNYNSSGQYVDNRSPVVNNYQYQTQVPSHTHPACIHNSSATYNINAVSGNKPATGYPKLMSPTSHGHPPNSNHIHSYND